MSEVQVTVGTNLTPLARGLEQAKAQVAQFGAAAKESLGIQSGSFAGFREEQRATRGIERFTAALANAKDPISGFTGALEGLSQGFRLTGSLFAGFAIGDFLREQLTKAAESASDFYDKTNQIFSVSSDSSKAFAQQAVKNFTEAQEAYGKEGFLEKLIYGAGQKATIQNGSAAVAQVQQDLNEYAARLINDQTAEISAGDDPFKKAEAQKQQVSDEYEEKIRNAKSPEEKAALAEQQAAKIAEIQRRASDEITKKSEEAQAKEDAKAAKAQERAKAIADEYEKQQKIQSDQADTTDAKKIEALRRDYEQKKLVADNTADELEDSKAITAEMEAQAKLATAIAEQEKKRSQEQYELFQKLDEQSEAQSAQRNALEEASIFHGETSSLRKIGLGGSTSQNNSEQVKQLSDANKRLDKIKDGINILNEKLDST